MLAIKTEESILVMENVSEIINGRVNQLLMTLSEKANEEFIHIYISDNGPGIPAEFKEKIYDPFFTTKETDKGTGLGLTMVYDIFVNLHKGSVELLDKEVGVGFHIKIPKNLKNTIPSYKVA